MLEAASGVNMLIETTASEWTASRRIPRALPRQQQRRKRLKALPIPPLRRRQGTDMRRIWTKKTTRKMMWNSLWLSTFWKDGAELVSIGFPFTCVQKNAIVHV